MERNSFPVDLNNPEDIAAKLVEGRKILARIDAQLAPLLDLQRESQELRVNLEFLASKAPDVPESIPANNGNGNERPRPGDLAVEVVNREVRPIRARAVRDILASEGHPLELSVVSNALHHAAHKAQRIKAASGRGMYAPLAYMETDFPSDAGAVGHQTSPNGHEPSGEERGGMGLRMAAS